jgi:hypothetical protein
LHASWKSPWAETAGLRRAVSRLRRVAREGDCPHRGCAQCDHSARRAAHLALSRLCFRSLAFGACGRRLLLAGSGRSRGATCGLSLPLLATMRNGRFAAGAVGRWRTPSSRSRRTHRSLVNAPVTCRTDRRHRAKRTSTSQAWDSCPAIESPPRTGRIPLCRRRRRELSPSTTPVQTARATVKERDLVPGPEHRRPATADLLTLAATPVCQRMRELRVLSIARGLQDHGPLKVPLLPTCEQASQTVDQDNHSNARNHLTITRKVGPHHRASACTRHEPVVFTTHCRNYESSEG